MLRQIVWILQFQCLLPPTRLNRPILLLSQELQLKRLPPLLR